MHLKLLLSFLTISAALASLPLRADALVEMMMVPVFGGIDTPTPRFSWRLAHEDRAQTQSAYRIVVFRGSDTVWNSGKVISAQRNLVPYGGPALRSQCVYTFTLEWWDEQDRPAPISRTGEFVMGPMSQQEWQNAGALWIAAAADNGNVYRKDFTVPGGVKLLRAHAYVAGIGFHEFRVNGAKVGYDALGGAWTTYSKRVLYRTYDLTTLLIVGAPNTIGVMLGRGWRDRSSFKDLDSLTPPEDNRERCLRMFVSADFADGRTGVILVASDGTWRETQGPIISDSVYNGETYDANLEQPGWDTPAFQNSSQWRLAAPVSGPSGVLRAHAMWGIEPHTTFPGPDVVTQPKPGMFIADFGQNFAGRCTLRVRGCRRGQRVQLRHAELLNSQGLIEVGNLVTAKATDIYICSGQGIETYTPRFTYHGFRYVEVTGYPNNDFTSLDLSAQHFASTLAPRTELQFSITHDNLLDRIQDAIVWSQRSNLMSVITDCPQRDERLGWLGDAALSAETLSLNFDTGALFYKVLNDFSDAMRSDGMLPDVVPYYRYGDRPADPGWSAAYPQLVWTLWKYFGDTDVIKIHWPHLNRYFNFLMTKVAQTGMGKLFGTYGDWFPPPPNPKAAVAFTSSYYFVAGLAQMSELAAAAGLQDDAERYSNLHTRSINDFNAAWYHAENNTYNLGLQTNLACALLAGAVPPERKDSIITQLLNDIVTVHGTHFTGGITGFKCVHTLLPKIGRADLAYALFQGSDYPSIGWMLTNPTQPSTTLWEIFDAITAPQEDGNSLNHHMFSSLGQTMFHDIAGLTQQEGSSGFDKVLFQPGFAGFAPGRARVGLYSQRGEVMMDWHRDGGTQCARAAAGMDLSITCGPRGGTVTRIDFASWGRAAWQCGAMGIDPKCHSPNSVAVVSASCLGKTHCEIPADSTPFGDDPCANVTKWLAVQVTCSLPSTTTAVVMLPPSSTALVRLPFFNLQSIVVTEGTTRIFQNGAFVPGVEGIFGASINARFRAVDVSIGSGFYQFRIEGNTTKEVCAAAEEGSAVELNCSPLNIQYALFASYGTTAARCDGRLVCISIAGNEVVASPLAVSEHHAGASLAVVERVCLGLATCRIPADSSLFGDPHKPSRKRLVVNVACGPELLLA